MFFLPSGIMTESGPSPFSPADLTLTGWWDPSDLSTMWQDTAGTTPVTADGDVVARIDDKSGNSRNFTQSTSGARPVYRTSGGLHWLEFAGSGDWMINSATLATLYGSTTFNAVVSARADSITLSTTPLLAPAVLHGDEGAVTVGWAATSLIGTSNFDGSTDYTSVANTLGDDVVVYARHESGTLYLSRNSVFVDASVASGSTSDLGSNDKAVLFTNYAQNQFMNGRLYGAATTTTALTEQERIDLTVWMGEKAGLTIPTSSSRGLFGGGYTGSYSNVIDYVTIETTGNATDFGDLSVARAYIAACSSSTRCLFGGGFTGSASSDVIDYVTFATTGNATDFGDLSVARYYVSACSSSTRGVFGGGTDGSILNVIDYVTIASTGNATDFGDLTVARYGAGACSSTTRGLFGGGYTGSTSDVIDYVTIATTGNATDFGDLTAARSGVAGCSSATRGLFGGGVSSDTIDYVTIATTGNATFFGYLTSSRAYLSACSSATRGVFAGGVSSNVIDYVTIASTGDATDFGDLTAARSGLAACSNAHGGL